MGLTGSSPLLSLDHLYSITLSVIPLFSSHHSLDHPFVSFFYFHSILYSHSLSILYSNFLSPLAFLSRFSHFLFLSLSCLQSGSSTVKRDLELVDQSMRTVMLTLWGETAQNFRVQADDVISCARLKLSEFGGRNQIL